MHACMYVCMYVCMYERMEKRLIDDGDLKTKARVSGLGSGNIMGTKNKTLVTLWGLVKHF